MKKRTFVATMTITGALLLGTATVFHPPLSNPWNVTFAMNEVAHDSFWRLDHVVFLVGIFGWLTGLAYFADTEYNSRDAARLFAVALAVWSLVLAAELAVLPQILHEIVLQDATGLQPIWGILFTWGLFSGYLAMLIVYVGFFLLSVSVKGWMSRAGMISSIIAIAGAVLSLCFPERSLWLQVTTAPLPYLWSLWLILRASFR
ncbi:MAG TPA: hypothetical protein VFK44_02080 [Bacillales bacterium]|nr:hypothetical protein [Bacillales bacterium]